MLDRFAQKALLADLDGLAETWATFRERHGDEASDGFCRGLESCAALLTEALARARKLADDAEETVITQSIYHNLGGSDMDRDPAVREDGSHYA